MAELFLDYMDIWTNKAERALEILGKEKFDKLMEHLKSGVRQSDVEQADYFEEFKKGLESSYDVTDADMSSKVEMSARIGGKITLQLLSKKNDNELPVKGLVTKAVDAELIERNIEMTEDDWALGVRDKARKIQAHEFMLVRGRGVREGVSQETDISAVEPLSEELKAFMDNYQDELLAAMGK